MLPSSAGASEQPADSQQPPPLHTWRVDYSSSGFGPHDSPAAPLDLFLDWLVDAREAGIAEPNAMTLASADGRGRPSARMVLLKAADSRGFSFFTNYSSRKGRELLGHPWAALVFPWQAMGRQVCVRGEAVRLPRGESEAYFATRPRDAQIGAWASQQSTEVSRDELVARMAGLTGHWAADEPIPTPTNWGGFVVVPEAIEFWVGRESRLHDRVEYRRVAVGGMDDGAAWSRRRLSP